MIRIIKTLHFLTVVVTAILLPIAIAHAVLQEKWHLLSNEQLGLLHQILLFTLLGVFVLPQIRNFIKKHKGST